MSKIPIGTYRVTSTDIVVGEGEEFTLALTIVNPSTGKRVVLTAPLPKPLEAQYPPKGDMDAATARAMCLNILYAKYYRHLVDIFIDTIEAGSMGKGEWLNKYVDDTGALLRDRLLSDYERSGGGPPI